MVIAPITRMRKREVDWLATHYCVHRHRYLDHYNCWLKEHEDELKIGFFDIETTNLKADYGIVLCYCIKPAGKNKILSRTITKADLETREVLDKEVVRSCIEDMQKFDLIVGHYSTRFDLPYLRSRALSMGLEFPIFGTIAHRDTYYMCRRLLCISSNRLESACRHVLGRTRKTHIDPKHWILALQGNEKALAYILDHCRRDVRDLEDLYFALIGFVKDTRKSI